MEQPELSQDTQSTNAANTLRWFQTSVGRICLGPRPDDALMQILKAEGVSHIATVQTSDEQADAIKALCESFDTRWVWLPIEKIRDSSKAEVAMLQKYLAELRQILTQGGSVYLHCDKSRYRCRLMFYALCHHLKMPSSSAYPAMHSFSADGANRIAREDLYWAADLGTSVKYQA